MQRFVRLTEERFTELMKASYEDGFSDGQLTRECDGPARGATDQEWADSVAKDTVDHEIKQARNG